MSRVDYAHLRPAVRRRLNRAPRHICMGCFTQRALYRYHGGPVRADKHHTLCFRCFRSERDRQRARTAA